MHHVLADGSEFVSQQGIQSLDEFRVSLHDLLLSHSMSFGFGAVAFCSVVMFAIPFKPCPN
jgi:hypothetical protein